MRIAGIDIIVAKKEPSGVLIKGDPLGLEYVLAIAEKKGHKTQLFSPPTESLDEGIEEIIPIKNIPQLILTVRI
jgi:hypothetical protein